MRQNPALRHCLALAVAAGFATSCATDSTTATDPSYIGPFYGPEYDPYYYDGYWAGGVWVGGGVDRPGAPAGPPVRPTHPIARPPMGSMPRPMPVRGGRR